VFFFQNATHYLLSRRSPSSSPAYIARVPDVRNLDAAISAVTQFLRTEIRDATLFLIQREELYEEAKRTTGDVSVFEDPQDIALAKETQEWIDKYERWLTREKNHVPVKDPVFQNIAWLCGVAHDALPYAIQDAKRGVEHVSGDQEREAKAHKRLKYIESMYLLIHDYIASVLKGNPSFSKISKESE
jgi:hypothetical protein